MKATLNQAIAALENGDEAKAWEIAQQDEGLDSSVTQAQWIAFAQRAIQQRAIDSKIHQSMMMLD